ncbi:hypothetical protein BOVATA_033150 [Babesia ovata]|uniref:Uncharacterized protein n=1 Tax=Babesia ovata TaxID=189622 RepID=A0A2H6KFQ1_9APIC|nr:uncharacterized protein BOVATA_033150 [Babesia ovata]GBE61822.1 hypothetical protein BOVATA_033150 [Babesia ovata]
MHCNVEAEGHKTHECHLSHAIIKSLAHEFIFGLDPHFYVGDQREHKHENCEYYQKRIEVGRIQKTFCRLVHNFSLLFAVRPIDVYVQAYGVIQVIHSQTYLSFPTEVRYWQSPPPHFGERYLLESHFVRYMRR